MSFTQVCKWVITCQSWNFIIYNCEIHINASIQDPDEGLQNSRTNAENERIWCAQGIWDVWGDWNLRWIRQWDDIGKGG